MNFLVDANLPKYFAFFHHPQFSFVSDLDPGMSDTAIWNYALHNDLIILTRDADFFSRSLLATHKPKVVFFRFGNMTLEQMHIFFTENWERIIKAIESNYLVVATPHEINVVI